MTDFVSFEKIGFQQWDEFCLKSDGAWFRHSSPCLQFCLRLNHLNKNLSFGIVDGGALLLVVPLIQQPIVEKRDLFEFAMGGDPTPYPAIKNDLPDSISTRLINSVFEKINELAKNNSVVYSRFFIDPLSKIFVCGAHRDNPLLKLGYNNISLTANIVDLSIPETELFHNIRDGYRYDIKKISQSNFVIDFFDKTSIGDEIFKIYKDIYFSSAGKEVGTKERWDATYELIKQGNAILALEKNEEGAYISGVVCFIYKNKAYYAFGATASDFKKMNGIGQLLQWEIIKYLKAHNFEHYGLGWNYYPMISDDVYSPKELNISFFKSGFGGIIHPLIRGEKFYDADYLKKRKNNLAEKFIEYYMRT